MTDLDASPAPLDLPAAGWEEWLSARGNGLLDQARRTVEELKRGGRDAHATMALWNDLALSLRNVFAVASVLSNTHPEEAVRALGERVEQEASRLETAVELDRDLFEVLVGVDASGLEAGARRVHERTLRDFRRAGVDQEETVRERLRALAERETEVGQLFARNIREDVRSVRVAPEVLDGMPADFVEAHRPGEDGLAEVTTEYPDYVPFMTFCRDREARAALLAQFLDRAHPANEPLLAELLSMRRERAGLLGYAGWPDFDAEVKMIRSGPAVPEFVERVSQASRPAAERDVALLLERLREDHPGADAVDGVDRLFYTEVLRRERFDVDAQQVRPYFAFPKVRRGLLDVTGRLFDLAYVEVDDAATWHRDVTSYDVWRAGRRLGRIHLDLHPRKGKYGHAAQFELAPGVAGRQLPEGVLVCNFSKGLMEHDHVVTLFHEFGHLLHHVLAGDQQWVRFSGVATEWDFVEAPSQMLEEWAWDAGVLRTFATDDAGEPIPASLVARMRAAKELGKAAHVATQMFYASLSYAFHEEVPADLSARLRELQAAYDVYAYVPGTHFYSSFGHLTGYGSAYYTYMWSLVIAKDLFSAFDPSDLFATDVAHRYRDTVLSRGGSADAADLVSDFLGRPYSFDAFAAWLSRG